MESQRIRRRQCSGGMAAGLLFLLLFGNWFTDRREWYGCLWDSWLAMENGPETALLTVCVLVAGGCAALLLAALLWSRKERGGDCLFVLAGGAGLLLTLLCAAVEFFGKAIFTTAIPHVFAALSLWLLLRGIRDSKREAAA